MAIEFEFYETPDASGGKTGKYHARAVTYRTVNTNEIAQQIQQESSLTITDVKAVLTALSHQVAYHLGESKRVHLEGIGYFQATLKCDKEVTDPQKARAQTVWFKSVKYRADEDMKKKLRNVGTVRSGIKNHSVSLTHEEINEKLAGFFQKENFLTRKRFEKLCQLTPTTASRHIKRLKEEGKIKNVNTRQQPIYVLVKNEDND